MTDARQGDMLGCQPQFQREITLMDMIAEVRRELAMRGRVYPGWVRKGMITQTQADRQMDLMAAILGTLEDLRKAGVVGGAE